MESNIAINRNLELCSSNTKQIVKTYLNEMKAQKKSKDSFNQYVSAVNRFIEVHNYQELDICNWETIYEYRDYKSKKSKSNDSDEKSAATINSQLNFLMTFLRFTQERFNIIYSFDIEEIKKLRLPETNKRNAIPFRMEEFIELREILKSKNLFYARFYIELVYYFGLSTNKAVGKYTIKNYDRSNKVFVLNGKKSKPVSHQLDNAITYIIDNQQFIPTNKEPFYHYVGEVEKYLDRTIQIKDIVQTRMEHFIKCPRCTEHYLPTPQNWVIMKYEMDQSFWQICVDCYKEMISNE